MYLLESPRRGDSNKYTKHMFPEEKHGNINKNTRSADFCADQIDVITNFAVITNVVITRVHCIILMQQDGHFGHWTICTINTA